MDPELIAKLAKKDALLATLAEKLYAKMAEGVEEEAERKALQEQAVELAKSALLEARSDDPPAEGGEGGDGDGDGEGSDEGGEETPADDPKSFTADQMKQLDLSIEKALHRVPGERKGSDGTMGESANISKYGRGANEKFSTVRAIRYMLFHDERHLMAPERKALEEGTDSAGGFLTPIEQSRELIELVRSMSVVEASGATVLPLNSDRLEVPKQTGAATANWIGEGVEITDSDQTFGQLVLTPKKLAAFTITSEELIMDSDPAVEDIINRDLAQVLALEEDITFIRGAGSATMPTGILNQAGVQLYTLAGDTANGATPVYDDYTNIVNLVEQVNGLGDGAWYMNARSKGTLRQIKDLEDRPLFVEPVSGEIPQLLGAPIWVTNQIPSNITKGTSSDTSEIYYGIPSQLVIGRRMQITLAASRESGSAFQNFQAHIRAVSRVDFGMRVANQWTATDGVRP